MKKSFISSAIWFSAGNLIYTCCQWLITIFVARASGFEDAGVLSLAMSITAMFQTVSLFGIRNFQVSDINSVYADNCYIGLRNLTSIAALAACMLFSFFNGYGAKQLTAIFFFMLFRLAECYSDVLHGVAQKNDRLDIAGKALVIKGIAALLSFYAGYTVSGSLNISLLFMACASWASTLCFDLPLIKRITPFRMSDDIRSCLLLARNTAPLCLYLFLICSISSVPKYILEKMCDETSLGIYSSIFAPALLIQAGASYIYSPFVSRFAKHNSDRDFGGFNSLALRITALIAAAAVVVVIASVFLGELALVIIFGEKIREYVYLLIPIIIAVFATACLSFVSVLEVVLRDFRGLIAGCGAGLLICFASTPVFINFFYLNGASFGLIAGSLTAAVICTFSMIRKEKQYISDAGGK